MKMGLANTDLNDFKRANEGRRISVIYLHGYGAYSDRPNPDGSFNWRYSTQSLGIANASGVPGCVAVSYRATENGNARFFGIYKVGEEKVNGVISLIRLIPADVRHFRPSGPVSGLIIPIALLPYLIDVES